MSDVSPHRQAFTFATLIVALGLLGTTLLALQFEGHIEAPPQRAVPQRSGSLAVARATEMPASTEALREMLAARLRLHPDARFVGAIRELSHLHGRAAPPVVAASWRGGQWDLTLDGRPFATLPEDADFDALLALVQRAAAVTAAERPLADAPAPAAVAWPILTPSRPVTATLAALDAAWSQGAHSPAVLRAVARSLVALCVETPDRVDAGDLLTARALAALAWARHAGHGDVEAEALLARHMGYDAAAERLAATLPADAPTRHWITRDDARLRGLATARDAPEDARYLWYRRLVELGDRVGAVAAWETWPIESRFGVSLQGFILEAYDHQPIDVYRGLVRDAPFQTLRALATEAGITADPTLPEFAVLRLALLAGQLPERGFFFDRAMAVARANAAVLSAVDDDLSFRMDVWSNREAILELASQLGDNAPLGYAPFAAWTRHVTGAATGTDTREGLLDDVGGDTWLGGSLRTRSYHTLASVNGDASVERLALERLVARLDGRPTHRAIVANEVGQTLADVPRQEAACDALLRLSRRAVPHAVAVCLDERADVAGLLRIAEDATVASTDRVIALQLAAQHRDVDVRALLDVWRTVDAAAPQSPPTERAEWLERHDRSPEAIAILRAWLDDHGTEPGLAAIHARARLGRLLRERGDAAASWALVERDLAGMAGVSLAEGALALAALRRFDEAEQVARRQLTRYGDGKAVAVLAEVLWTHGEDERAATELKQHEALLSEWAWRWNVGTAFARVHRRSSVEAAQRAFAPLTRRRLGPSSLWRMTAGFFSVNRPDLIVATYGMVNIADAPHTMADSLFHLMQEHGYRRRAQGPEAALAWLRTQVTPAQQAVLAMGAYPFGETEVLWSVAAPVGTPSEVESVWLLRQCDALQHPAPSPHQAELDAHYAGTTPTDYAVMARYLRGEVELPALLRLAVDEHRRTEISYYIGLRAAAEGRIADATDWFTFTGLAGTLRDGEHTWARTALTAWRDRDEPVAALTAHPWPAPDNTAAPSAPTAAAPTTEAPRGHRRHRRDASTTEEHHGHRRHRR